MTEMERDDEYSMGLVIESPVERVRYGVPTYQGPYPVRRAVRQALDERYGVCGWVHDRGGDRMMVFYLPAADYARANAALVGPQYNGLDSKYNADKARQLLLDLYAKGVISYTYMQQLLGLDP